MIRDIIFRGKDVYDNRWVVGHYFTQMMDNGTYGKVLIHVIRDENYVDHQIFISTLCQYIGVKDKNDKYIFEGDILNVYTLKHSRGLIKATVYCFVVFSGGMFYPKPFDSSYKWGLLFDDCEVIDNIIDVKTKI